MGALIRKDMRAMLVAANRGAARGGGFPTLNDELILTMPQAVYSM